MLASMSKVGQITELSYEPDLLGPSWVAYGLVQVNLKTVDKSYGTPCIINIRQLF
jgi:hypothetical protein